MGTTMTLKADEKQNVSYCVPLWLRDEQIKINTARVKGRIQKGELHPEPIAIVCYGPSLNDTWEQVRDFKYIMTCSGAHKFLIARGIVPTYHVDVDPREHKIALLGQPHTDVEYLLASTCHPKYFELLTDFRVKLWHIFESKEDSFRTLPHGEWALFGGSDAGLRSMVIARFLGFTNQHVFGMDGCEGQSGKHAAAHPSQPKGHGLVEYPIGSGVMWKTTPAMLECARQVGHELDQLPDVKATFHGEGLVQEMVKHYKPEPLPAGTPSVGIVKPELISADYRELNERLHRDNLAYGVGGGKHADTVIKLADSMKTRSVLDYGCGKGYLAKALPFPIWEYDPAIPEKAESPRPADLVVCTDVLEHIEPDKLVFVLDDLRRVVQQVGFFVIHTGPSSKQLADGRNSHLIQRDERWWTKHLRKFFKVGKTIMAGPLLYVVVAPKMVATTPAEQPAAAQGA